MRNSKRLRTRGFSFFNKTKNVYSVALLIPNQFAGEGDEEGMKLASGYVNFTQPGYRWLFNNNVFRYYFRRQGERT